MQRRSHDVVWSWILYLCCRSVKAPSVAIPPKFAFAAAGRCWARREQAGTGIYGDAVKRGAKDLGDCVFFSAQGQYKKRKEFGDRARQGRFSMSIDNAGQRRHEEFMRQQHERSLANAAMQTNSAAAEMIAEPHRGQAGRAEQYHFSDRPEAGADEFRGVSVTGDRRRGGRRAGCSDRSGTGRCSGGFLGRQRAGIRRRCQPSTLVYEAKA